MSSSIYVHIARSAIQARLDGLHIDKNLFIASHPELNTTGACFVTLNLHGHLRGCIGSIIAHRPLIDDLISNAEAAAFRDPRFSPLTSDEFEDVEIEVSLLTPPEPVTYSDAAELSTIIRPGIDGVIIRLGNYQATFLPQVWDELRDFNSFFSHLGLKAGIGNDPLSMHPEVYVYQVDKFDGEL